MDGTIWESIITPQMAALAAGVIAVMLFIGRIPIRDGKAKLNEMNWWKQWGIFLMFALAVGGSFMPGVHDISYAEWGSILVHGATTGMVALLGRTILKPIILARLEGKTAPKE